MLSFFVSPALDDGAALAVLLFVPPFAGFVVGAVLSALGFLGRTVVSSFVFLWPFIQRGLQLLGIGLNRLRVMVFGWARQVANFGGFLWESALSPVVEAIQGAFGKLQTWLKRVFSPIAQVLKKINELLDKVYEKIVRPILRIFDVARATLRLLDKLGVEWAGRLEAMLFRIERRIFESFLQVRATLNTITNFVNNMLDLEGFLKRRLLLTSIGKYINEIWALLVNSGIRRDPFFGLKRAKGKYPAVDFDEAVSLFRQEIEDPGEGQLEGTARFTVHAFR